MLLYMVIVLKTRDTAVNNSDGSFTVMGVTKKWHDSGVSRAMMEITRTENDGGRKGCDWTVNDSLRRWHVNRCLRTMKGVIIFLFLSNVQGCASHVLCLDRYSSWMKESIDDGQRFWPWLWEALEFMLPFKKFYYEEVFRQVLQ